MSDRAEHRVTLFQSAPPHGGRPGCASLGIGHCDQVSIRAPARGATKDLVAATAAPHCRVVSIRAPARGATCPASARRAAGEQFQSAPPHGGRRRVDSGSQAHDGVSIRAPARGATRGIRSGATPPQVSIRAPARGATDLQSGLMSWASLMFQSAPPHGGRPVCHWFPAFLQLVSIRAPARGATLSSAMTARLLQSFNPRPRTGGDALNSKRTCQWTHVSIRAPARGATVGALNALTSYV